MWIIHRQVNWNRDIIFFKEKEELRKESRRVWVQYAAKFRDQFIVDILFLFHFSRLLLSSPPLFKSYLSFFFELFQLTFLISNTNIRTSHTLYTSLGPLCVWWYSWFSFYVNSPSFFFASLITRSKNQSLQLISNTNV